MTDRYRLAFFFVGLLMAWLVVFGAALFLNGLDEILKALP